MKRLGFLISMLMVVACVFAGNLDYVFGNNLSSVSFEEKPSAGSVFCDENGNVLIARRYPSDATVFDIRYSKGPYERGCSLTSRGPVNTIGIMGGTKFALASYSVTTSWYPLEPLAVAGIDYSSGGVSALVGAGFRIVVPLANLWDAQFTMIQNGKFTGWCALGADIGSSVNFASIWGISYRHNLSSFYWELGYSRLDRPSALKVSSPYLGIGVDL